MRARRVMRIGAAVLVLALAACGEAPDAGESGIAPAPGAERATARDDTDPAAVPGADDGVVKSAPAVRAARRAYDGAPPVVPHGVFSSACTSCHNEQGIAVVDVGFAPPMPHALTDGLGATSRCTQCHVYRATTGIFRGSSFRGVAQDLRAGERAYPGAPPVMPHAVQMRENCRACHSGPAAREIIRTPHADRLRCEQCHVPRVTDTTFKRP